MRKVTGGLITVAVLVFGVTSLAHANTVTDVKVNCFLAKVFLTHFPGKYTTKVHVYVQNVASGKDAEGDWNVKGDDQTITIDIHDLTHFGGKVGQLKIVVTWDLVGQHHVMAFWRGAKCGVAIPPPTTIPTTVPQTTVPATVTTVPTTDTTRPGCQLPEGCGSTTTTVRKVTSTTVIRIGTPTSVVRAAVPSADLPKTGGSSWPIVGAGIVSLLAGVAAVAGSRKRAA